MIGVVNAGEKKRTRIPVSVDIATHELAKAYSELTGVPMARVIANAVKDWMETVGAARMEALAHNIVTIPLSNLVSFPAPAELASPATTGD